ncbi:MAG: RNA polymerase sigma factor [Actinomycetes bacterium]
MSSASPSDDELARVVRESSGRLVAMLARRLGNFDVAEEAVADAVVEALRSWRTTGVPDNPPAWLMAAAGRNAIDALRREQRYREKLALVQEPEMTDTADERLPLIFLCCHPALSRDARLALTLRAVMGLTVPEIARALLVQDSAVAARITRAKKKVVAAGIPMVTPSPVELAERLDLVLTVIYLAYNEGHLSTAGSGRRDLAEDAIWLATLVATQLPREPEALGLLALLVLSHARVPARFGADGSLVLMSDQVRSKWDASAIAEGRQLVERAAALHSPGRFQIQAAIAAVHAEAPTFEATDWPQILVLYDALLSYDDSPVVRLNRAVAVAYARSPEEALREVDALEDSLADYHLLHSTRAELLRAIDRPDEARAEDERALALTANAAERALLAARIGSG